MISDQFLQKFQELTPKPRSVLILMLEAYEDGQIAQELGASEATVRKHIQNLCDHFAIPAEIDGIRKNRRQELMAIASQYKSKLLENRKAALRKKRFVFNPKPSPIVVPSREKQDWGGAPDVSPFYGRTQELEQLKTWILQDDCRLLALLGMSGMGKTTLSVKLAQEIQEEFDYVIWRSLRNTPSLEKILKEWLEFLYPDSPIDSSHNLELLISQLLKQLQKSRCLLVLDEFDRVLKSGDFVGHYLEEYKGYGQLLKRLGEQSHKSCLLLVSLEKPREIALLEGETFPVRSLTLAGLGEAAAEILKAKGLSGEDRWKILIKLYRGNPLALKMVASTIKELFAGSVTEFLEMSLTGIVQDIIFLVEQQFLRLSPLEKDLMYWLAIAQESVSLAELRSYLPVSELTLFTTLKSLAERSLIEKGAATFSLQPAVREYVRNQFSQEIIKEIKQFSPIEDVNILKLFKTHCLKPSKTQQNVKKNEASSISTLLKQKLLIDGELTMVHQILEQLRQTLEKLQVKTPLEIGYAYINLEYLIKELQNN